MKLNQLSKYSCKFFKAGEFDLTKEINAARNSEGDTPLTFVIKYGNIKILQELIDAKADINQNNDDPQKLTPLVCAIIRGKLDMVSLLLKQSTIQINKSAINNILPLNMASTKGFDSIVTTLIEMKAEIDAANAYGETALYCAASCGHLSVVKILIQHKADVNHLTKIRSTALSEALVNGHSTIVSYLLKHGATTKTMGLHASSSSGVLVQGMFPGFLQKAAPKLSSLNSDDPKKSKKVTTIIGKSLAYNLCKAASENDIKQINELFFQDHVNINKPYQCKVKSTDPNDGTVTETTRHSTALHYACHHGHLEAAKRLIELGADINALSSEGKKPIDMVKKLKDEFNKLFKETVKLDDSSSFPSSQSSSSSLSSSTAAPETNSGSDTNSGSNMSSGSDMSSAQGTNSAQETNSQPEANSDDEDDRSQSADFKRN